MNKKLIIIFMMSLVGSCASMNEKLPGYTQAQLEKKKSDLKGSTRSEMIQKLGKPVAEGLCYSGSKIGVGNAIKWYILKRIHRGIAMH